MMRRDSGKANKPLRAIFFAPLIIAIISILGLVTALTGDGPPDRVAWAALSVPLLVTFWAMGARRR